MVAPNYKNFTMNLEHLTVPNFKFISYGIPIETTNAGDQFNFPVNQYLKDGAKIYGIQVFTDNDISVDPNNTSFTTFSFADLQNWTVTLYMYAPGQGTIDTGNKGEWIKNLPLTCLHSNFNTNSSVAGSSVVEKFICAGFAIDWNQSFIKKVKAYTIGSNKSCVFGINYNKS